MMRVETVYPRGFGTECFKIDIICDDGGKR